MAMSDERLAKTLPYTTPSGHTYHAPTDYRSLSARVMDYLQSIIECWEEDESPPDPLAFRDYAKLAWNEAVRANDEIDRLRAEVELLRKAHEEIVTPMAGEPKVWRACDGFDVYEPELSESCRGDGSATIAASDHAGYCSVRVAWDALNPEPTT